MAQKLHSGPALSTDNNYSHMTRTNLLLKLFELPPYRQGLGWEDGMLARLKRRIDAGGVCY